MSVVIPNFVGAFAEQKAPKISQSVFLNTDPSYETHRYQYGYTSNKEHVHPAIIAYPKDEKDIAAAIKFAKERKISVAIRTGGHQYCAASSTTGDNMQLDLSRTFNEFEDIGDFEIYRKIRIGVSFALSDFIKKAQANKEEKSAQYPNGKPGYFIPTGICAHVHIGGHCQTGGYGQLGRAFGLFGDHIRTVEFVDANGQIRSVTRGEGTQDDKDLFYAILGGSPGNFGVITHVTLLLRKDEHHKESRGLKIITFYTKEILQQLLDVKALMANPTEKDPEIGGGLDYCVTVLGGTMSMWLQNHGLDKHFRDKHRTWFGGDDGSLPDNWPKSIVIYAQWADTDGEARNPEDMKKAIQWMDKIRNIAKGTLGHFYWTLNNHNDQTAMSVLAKAWVFCHVREFDLQYHKRCYLTNSTTLIEDGWAKWATNRIDAAMQHTELKMAVQIQNFGGQTSKFRSNGETGETAYSWRKDSNICSTMDCFYEGGWGDKARAWCEENDLETGPNGKFKVDRRVLWASYGEYDMEKAKMLYFEDEQKYQNIARIRLKADPTGLFAANTFCVGWKQIPGKEESFAVKEETIVGKSARIVSDASNAFVTFLTSSCFAPPVDEDYESEMVKQLNERNPAEQFDSGINEAEFSGFGEPDVENAVAVEKEESVVEVDDREAKRQKV